MKEKKLKESWKLEQRLLENGKEKRIPVYTGSYYHLKHPVRPLLTAGWSGLALYLVCAVLFMELNLSGTHCIYVLPVFLCGLFPMAYWAMGLFSLRRSSESMTSVQKEKGPSRILKSTLGCMIFSAASFLGDLILLFSQQPPKEWIDALLLVLAFAASLAVFLPFRAACSHITEKKGDSRS